MYMGFHFLVAYDGSPQSANAITYACDLAETMDECTLTIAYAVQPDIYEAAHEDEERMGNFAERYRREILRTINQAEERGQEYLADAAEKVASRGQHAETKLLYGDPVNRILEEADTGAVDSVIVGHRGQSDRPDSAVGSVAKGIIERAPVPVIVTR